jgi:hypothetical protein
MIIKDNTYLNSADIVTFGGSGCQDEVIVLYDVTLCHFCLKYLKEQNQGSIAGKLA